MFRNIPTYVLLAVALLLTTCNAPEAYRQALDAFSQGAALEISQDEAVTKPGSFVELGGLYPASTSTSPTNQKAGFFYSKTQDLLVKALKGESQLAKLGILDNAYTLQALTYWRQDNYEGVERTLSKMDTLAGGDSDPDDIRDAALRIALPGLVKLDQAYAALQESEQAMDNIGDTPTDAREAKYNTIKEYYTTYATANDDGAPSVQRGLAIIDFALQDIPKTEDIYLYLLNSKLAGLDTWGDLLANTFMASRRLSVSSFAPGEAQWVAQEREAYESRRTEMLAKLEAVVGSKTHELYRYWEGVL